MSETISDIIASASYHFLANVTVFTPFGPLDSSSPTLRIFSNSARGHGNNLGIIYSEEITEGTNASLRYQICT
jgi:hypothetical protein